MTSNIRIQKICQHCGKEFTAKTTVTKYCGEDCAKRAYKQRMRDTKIQGAEYRVTKVHPYGKPNELDNLKDKEFLTVPDAAKLMGFSARTVYRFVLEKKVHAVNLGERMTRIKRSDLDRLFVLPYSKEQPVEQVPAFNIEDCYLQIEIQEKYGLSRSTIQALANKHEVPKIRKGKFVYYPKVIIDQLLAKNE